MSLRYPIIIIDKLQIDLKLIQQRFHQRIKWIDPVHQSITKYDTKEWRKLRRQPKVIMQPNLNRIFLTKGRPQEENLLELTLEFRMLENMNPLYKSNKINQFRDRDVHQSNNTHHTSKTLMYDFDRMMLYDKYFPLNNYDYILKRFNLFIILGIKRCRDFLDVRGSLRILHFIHLTIWR